MYSCEITTTSSSNQEKGFPRYNLPAYSLDKYIEIIPTVDEECVEMSGGLGIIYRKVVIARGAMCQLDVVDSIYIVCDDGFAGFSPRKITYELENICKGKVVKISRNLFELKNLPRLFIFSLVYFNDFLNIYGLDNIEYKIFAAGGYYHNDILSILRNKFSSFEPFTEYFSHIITDKININIDRIEKFLVVKTNAECKKIEIDDKDINIELLNAIIPHKNNLLIDSNTYYIPLELQYINMFARKIVFFFLEKSAIEITYSRANFIFVNNGTMIRKY